MILRVGELACALLLISLVGIAMQNVSIVIMDLVVVATNLPFITLRKDENCSILPSTHHNLLQN